MKIVSIPTTVALLAAGSLFSTPLWAQVGACGEERDIKQGLMDEPTHRRMNEAFELVGEERYAEAMEDLVYLENRAKGEYVQAVVAQAIAQVHWAEGNFDEALKEFEKAVALNALPNRAHFSLMYQIAQLYYSKERFDDALERLELWFCKVPVEDHKATAYVLEASIRAQKEQWPQVVESIDTAISMEEEPKEAWYQLKLAALYELEDFPAAAETLEILVSNWPNKKVYWTQLSNTYYKLEQDKKALSAMALAYRKGLLDKQQDLMFLVNLYSLQDVPFKAAQVMQKGLEEGVIENSERHWTMTGDNWYAAEEYEEALEAFENSGKVADEGKIDLRRGYILVDMERWDEATEALRAAIDKGGLGDRQTGDAYLMLGMSEFSQGNYDQASTAWGRAGRYESAQEQARQWMIHMREERGRQTASR